MPSWNLERCRSQWGLATGCRGSSLEERGDQRGPLEGAAEVEVPEAGLRQDLRVSSCGGGSIQRPCQQFQPVALLFSCTNSHYAEEKGESYPKRFQRPSDCEKSKPCHCYGWRGMRSVVTRRRRFPLLLHACFQVPVSDLALSLCPHRSRDVTFFPATRLPFFSNSF